MALKINNRQILKDVFENFGYIDLDAMTDERENLHSELIKYLKSHFITWEKIKPAGVGNMWPEFRFTGVRSYIEKMAIKFWSDEGLMEFFVNI